jgi:hypothetical protein
VAATIAALELIAVILMLCAGGMIAVIIGAAAAVARSADSQVAPARGAAERNQIAASLLFHVVAAGGGSRDAALRLIRQKAAAASSVVSPIDVTTWGSRFAELSTREERERLLATAVSLACEGGRTLPLMQYVSLLDLSFALGFRTDALARLRERFGFDYIDHARMGRTADAERTRVSFERAGMGKGELLRTLGIEGEPTRQELIAAYHRLATLHHPDRFHAAGQMEQDAAALRFIEISQAYESLLAIYRE